LVMRVFHRARESARRHRLSMRTWHQPPAWPSKLSHEFGRPME
jgi:hypothetical protein